MLLLTLFKTLAAAMAVLLPPAPPSTPAEPPMSEISRPETVDAFFHLLMEKTERGNALRARFAADPAGTLRTSGIDPTPYNLPAKMTEGEIDALMRGWQAARAPMVVPVPVPPPVQQEQNMQVAVYGPPPGLREPKEPKP